MMNTDMKITACNSRGKNKQTHKTTKGRGKRKRCQQLKGRHCKSHDQNKMAATTASVFGRARAGSSKLPVQRDADGNEAEVD